MKRNINIVLAFVNGRYFKEVGMLLIPTFRNSPLVSLNLLKVYSHINSVNARARVCVFVCICERIENIDMFLRQYVHLQIDKRI